MFERAKPSVSVTCFIGNRPRAQSWTARSVFCSRQLERLLEDLVLHRLAAEQPFEIAHPLFQSAQLGRRRDLIIGACFAWSLSAAYSLPLQAVSENPLR